MTNRTSGVRKDRSAGNSGVAVQPDVDPTFANDRALDLERTHGNDQALDRLEAICRQRGGRMTRQRRAVLGKLLAGKRPLSAYELRDLLRPDDPSATPASVYRCLDFLVEHGLVHRLETTKSFVACEHPDHPHAVQFLICRQCGAVVEAEDKRIAAATESLGQRLGFALDHRTVELTGICPICKADDQGAAQPHV